MGRRSKKASQKTCRLRYIRNFRVKSEEKACQPNYSHSTQGYSKFIYSLLKPLKMNENSSFSKIVKRNGEICDFKAEKIEQAIFKAMRATGNPHRKTAHNLCNKVIEILKSNTPEGIIPHVEIVQDTVELVLFQHGDFHLLKIYLLYRKQHEQIRNSKVLLTNIEVMDNYLTLKR